MMGSRDAQKVCGMYVDEEDVIFKISIVPKQAISYIERDCIKRYGDTAMVIPLTCGFAWSLIDTVAQGALVDIYGLVFHHQIQSRPAGAV